MLQTVHVVARFQARPDRIKDLETLAKGLLQPTRAEPGCVRYELWRDQSDPARFAMVEEWRSAADLEAHFLTPHFKHAAAHLPALLATPLEIGKFDRAG